VSDPSSTGNENTRPPKPKVSPARNAVGLVGLLILIAIAVFQYWAFFGFNAAVHALEARSQDEEKGLVDIAEVERLIGKTPDGPGSDFLDGNRTFTKTTYTWRGLRSYTLTAYYTKGLGPCLHHFETESAKYAPEPVVSGVNAPVAADPNARKPKGKTSAPVLADGAPKAAAAKDAAPAPAGGPGNAAAAVLPSKPAPPKAPADAKDPK
jgi:hypothetical protein